MSRLADFMSRLGLGKAPQHLPPPASLSAVSHAERTAALTERETEIESHHSVVLQDLTRQQTEAHASREAAIAEARAIVEAQAAKADAEIAEQIRARVYPLVAQFIHARDAKGNASSPRDTAGALAEVWRELAARVSTEVGGTIESKHLGYALLECLGGEEAVRASSSARFWESDAPNSATYNASKAMIAGEPVPVIEEALRVADVTMARETRHSHVRDAELNPERHAVCRAHACSSRRRTAVLALDAERAEKERKEWVANAEAEAGARDTALARQNRRRDLTVNTAAHDEPTPDVVLNPDMSIPASLMARASSPGA